MATHTQLRDRDFAALADAFDLGAVQTWRATDGGLMNSNFRVETTRGAFVIRVNEDKSPADIVYEVELVNALADAGVSVPRPRPSRTGAWFHDHEGHLVSAFPWMSGQHVPAVDITAAHARALGRTLAQLHRAGRPLVARLDRDGIYTFERIVARLDTIRAARDPALEPAQAIVEDEIAWLRSMAAVRAAAPTGVIHNDLFPDNVLFDAPPQRTGASPEGPVPVLLDFEQASTGSLAFDLAVCLNAWCVDEGDAATGAGYRIASERMRAMIAGYRAGGAVAASEWPAVTAALAVEVRAAAMRFTVTRITDAYLRKMAMPDKDYRHFLYRVVGFRRLGCRDLLATHELDK